MANRNCLLEGVGSAAVPGSPDGGLEGQPEAGQCFLRIRVVRGSPPPPGPDSPALLRSTGRAEAGARKPADFHFHLH